MLITRTKSSHFCSATFSKALVGSRLHPDRHPLPGLILLSVQPPMLRTKHSSRRGSLPAQLCQQAAHHTSPWAQVWGHLDLYGLGVSSPPRSAVFIPSSHMVVRQIHILSLDFPRQPRVKGRGVQKQLARLEPLFIQTRGPALPLTLPWLTPVCQTGKGLIATMPCLWVSAQPCYWSSPQENSRREGQKGRQHRKGGSALSLLCFSPSHSEGFGFPSNCQQSSKPINRQPQIKGTRREGGDGLTSQLLTSGDTGSNTI